MTILRRLINEKMSKNIDRMEGKRKKEEDERKDGPIRLTRI